MSRTIRTTLAAVALCAAPLAALAHPPDPCGADGPAATETHDLGAGVILTIRSTACAPTHEPHAGDGVRVQATATSTEPVMPYATREDLDARFGAAEINDVAAADSDDVDARPDAAARVAAVLADASAEIDAVLADGYDLPLPAGGYPLLTAACCDIARLRLYDDSAPDRVMGRASSARKRVRQLAAGELHLVAADGTRVERRTTILVDAGEPVATRERLAGYLGPADRHGRRCT